jgi:HSP20 family protein
MFDLVTWPRNPWSIFDELESLQQDMNRMLTGQQADERGRRGRAWRRSPTYPLMNIWSSADGLVIDAELPGVDPKDVDISVTGDQLILRGKVNAGADMDGETYHRRERPAGEFTRTLQLPFRADSGAVKANYKNGVLRLAVPRSEDEKPRKIAIEAS